MVTQATVVATGDKVATEGVAAFNAAVNAAKQQVNTAGNSLSALDKNRYDNITLKYPLDLGVAGGKRGHVVHFDIYRVEPAKFELGGATLTEKASNLAGSVVDFGEAQIKNMSSTESGTIRKLQFKAPVTSTRTQIELYIPETLNFSYNFSYNDLSATELAQDVISGGIDKLPGLGRLKGAIGSIPGIKDMARLAMQSAGYAINPQQQLLFRGVDFRTYQMSFVFTPHSQKEADVVNSIIQVFKRYASPTIVNGTAGFLMVPPGVFDISFKFDGNVNENISKIKRSVIESIDVNYAPNGFATHGDGMPVQTVLTIGFKETEIIDSTDIDPTSSPEMGTIAGTGLGRHGY
jgi:hypothetical protein